MNVVEPTLSRFSVPHNWADASDKDRECISYSLHSAAWLGHLPFQELEFKAKPWTWDFPAIMGVGTLLPDFSLEIVVSFPPFLIPFWNTWSLTCVGTLRFHSAHLMSLFSMPFSKAAEFFYDPFSCDVSLSSQTLPPDLLHVVLRFPYIISALSLKGFKVVLCNVTLAPFSVLTLNVALSERLSLTTASRIEFAWRSLVKPVTFSFLHKGSYHCLQLPSLSVSFVSPWQEL